MKLKEAHSIYFVGIGGIGMSALAKYFHMQGKLVAGYDKTPSTITNSLEDLGVAIHFEDSISSIPTAFNVAEKTIVIYTPAIPKSSNILNHFRNNHFTILKRSEALDEITRDTFCFAVAGTHGKTTTSSILGHLLKTCNASMTAFVGGITENYKSNLILNGDAVSVVEADEFDRSFLKLHPDVICITSMDADHLDIYGEAAAITESFNEFANKISDKNNVFVRNGLPLAGKTYGIADHSDYSIESLKIQDGAYHFDIKTPKEQIKNVVFNYPGKHNLLNGLVAFAMAYSQGYDKQLLVEGLATFKGVERRFTYQIKTAGFVLIDDYAHHPTEINAVHEAITAMYPNEEVMAIFQPHLFSRTKDFVDDFAKSLSKFNKVRLLDIYPAREEPIGGVTSSWLLDKITTTDKKLINKEKIASEILESKVKIAVTIGAGDIGVEVPKIKQKLTNEMALG